MAFSSFLLTFALQLQQIDNNKHHSARMKWFKTDNDILQFLINFFLIETIGQLALFFVCFIFRFFGMPQVYFFVRSTPLIHHIVFTVLLLIAIGISVISILRKRKEQSQSNSTDAP